MKSFLSELRLYCCNRWVSAIPSHTFRLWFYRHVMNFSIGTDSSIFMNCVFDRTGGLTIGANTIINAGCHLDNRGSITIGNNVSVSQQVTILTADHKPDTPNFEGQQRPVAIEDYVWIGTRATILPGCVISKGAVIAAGAVVTKNVEPFAMVGGVPAKFIRYRSNVLSYQLKYRRLFQ